MPILTFLIIQSSNRDDAGGGLCGGTGFLLLITVVLALVVSFKAESKRLNEVRENYFSALADLRRDPTNRHLREYTFVLGRIYSELTRSREEGAVYDEIALSNDIIAACAAPVSPSPPSSKLVAFEGQESADIRLQKLEGVPSLALIPEEESERMRRRLREEI